MYHIQSIRKEECYIPTPTVLLTVIKNKATHNYNYIDEVEKKVAKEPVTFTVVQYSVNSWSVTCVQNMVHINKGMILVQCYTARE